MAIVSGNHFSVKIFLGVWQSVVGRMAECAESRLCGKDKKKAQRGEGTKAKWGFGIRGIMIDYLVFSN